MDLNKQPRKREIVYGVLERAKNSVDAEQWFVGYYAARDEGVRHERAMDLADEYVREVS